MKPNTFIHSLMSTALALLLVSVSLPCYAAERVALVIGNNAYKYGTPLNNCINDARAVTKALKDVGFQVIVAEDASLQQMEAKVLDFRRAAQGAKAAWFFYSGHGAEVKGANYLVPVDAEIKDEFQIKHKTFALDQLMGAMDEAGTPLKVVVLDCCRDNPFGKGWSRSGARGLGQVGETPKGTIIAFATAPGKVASDGSGKNSPFTTALVSAIAKRGLEIDQVFKETGRAVLAATANEQQPWINSSYFDSFVLARGTSAGSVTLPSAVPASDDYGLFAGTTAGERKLVEVAPGVSIPFRWCPPGTFTMGGPAEEQALAKKWGLDASDETQHRVTLTKGFWLAETEVTQGQWQAVMDTGLKDQARKALQDDTLYQISGKKQTYRDAVSSKKGDDPSKLIGLQSEQVVMYFVNHSEAEDWCAAASRHAGVRGWRVTLPSEAQWEYACRAGTGGMTYAGDFTIKGKNNAPGLDAIAWYAGNSSKGYSGKGWDTKGFEETQYPSVTAGPRRVGQKQANDWGLDDMLGNVFEWCGDWYGGYPMRSVTDPMGASSGANRVIRGGSWNGNAASSRAAYRNALEPGIRSIDLGFRPALVPSR